MWSNSKKQKKIEFKIVKLVEKMLLLFEDNDKTPGIPSLVGDKEIFLNKWEVND